MSGTSSMRGGIAAGRIIELLSFAATPTFAVMAMLTGAFDAGPPDMLCAAAMPASPLNGMVLMYLLMSVFHSGPWLRSISGKRRMAPKDAWCQPETDTPSAPL